jgi:fermentation-respiration switch protein FrsA (DUF1100 family)
MPMQEGGEVAAWYIRSRNGAAVLLIHGSSGSRARVADRARMLARHGYGVLALDLPGNGESDGRSSGLGWTAQPGIDAALDFLTSRPEIDAGRIAGFGVSLGGEVLLEAASRDPRLDAVISDGAARSTIGGDLNAPEGPSGMLQKAQLQIGMQLIRATSGTRPAPPLEEVVGRIAPRPVLLVASGHGAEVNANHIYRNAIGNRARLWVIPEASHTGGLKSRPAQYERRTIRFLDRTLGPSTAAARAPRRPAAGHAHGDVSGAAARLQAEDARAGSRDHTRPFHAHAIAARVLDARDRNRRD